MPVGNRDVGVSVDRWLGFEENGADADRHDHREPNQHALVKQTVAHLSKSQPQRERHPAPTLAQTTPRLGTLMPSSYRCHS